MKKDTKKTDVKFYYERHNNEVFAFFPADPYHHAGHPDYKSVFTCYAHVGQHSGCNISYVKGRKKCTNEADFMPLKSELESLGYNLNILN